MPKHKDHDALIALANLAPLQYRHREDSSTDWKDWDYSQGHEPNICHPMLEWRPTPRIVTAYLCLSFNGSNAFARQESEPRHANVKVVFGEVAQGEYELCSVEPYHHVD